MSDKLTNLTGGVTCIHNKLSGHFIKYLQEKNETKDPTPMLTLFYLDFINCVTPDCKSTYGSVHYEPMNDNLEILTKI